MATAPGIEAPSTAPRPVGRTLGRTSVVIPAIGQGTHEEGPGAWSPERDDERVRALRLGLDLGMALVDTAAIYGDGRAETLIGDAIRGRRRDVLIATKFAPEQSAYDAVIRSAHGSLTRLRTDYIDVYQTHWPNRAVPFEETLRAFRRLLEDGAIRWVGLSNASLSMIAEAQRALGDRLVSVQHQYNVADRVVEQDVLPWCERESLTFLAYSPLLVGRVLPGDARRDQVRAIARRHGITEGQLVLRWLLARRPVVPIPKAWNETHVRANAAVAALELDDDVLRELDRLYAPTLVYLDPARIELDEPEGRHVYRTLEQAVRNDHGMVPSPVDLAADIREGTPQRPVKVRRREPGDERYVLVEGRLRYWAWVIAYEGRKPIAALEV